MATIAFDVTAETKAMVAQIQKLEAKVTRLQGRLSGAGNKGAGAFGKAGKAVENLTGQLVGAAGVTGAVLAVVNTVKGAYRDMLENHRRFLRNIEKTADAKGRFLWNFGGAKEKAQAEKLAERVASRAGITLPRSYDILSAAYSSGARGKALESSAAMAGRLERIGVGEGTELVKAAVNLEKITGKGDAMANFAFLRQVGKSANLTDIRAQLNLMTALGAGAASGERPEEIAELTSAVTQMMAGADPEGRISGTGVANLIKRLQQTEIIAEQSVDRATGKTKETLRRARGTTTMERLADLQAAYAAADESGKADILKRLGGEAKMSGPLRNILGRTAQYQKYLGAAQQDITAPGGAAAMGAFREFLGAFGTGGEGITGAARRGRAALETGETLGQERVAAQAAARDLAERYLKGQGFLGGVEARSEAFLSNALGQRARQQPEYFRRLIERNTPEDKRDSTQFRELMASMQDLQAKYTAATLKEAGLDRLAGSIDRMSSAAERLADAATKSPSQDVD